MEIDHLLYVLNEQATKYTYDNTTLYDIRTFHLADKLTKQQTFSNIELGILNSLLINRDLPYKERKELGGIVLLSEIKK
ncbi:hypothetical protein [Bacillus cereus]|uniref:hypothetical protein n=1 Tax=Bacillus cereus TaxID=1396 RepID=UPI001D0CE4DF|nr:hypothetical protein [Bacillus cereus]